MDDTAGIGECGEKKPSPILLPHIHPPTISVIYYLQFPASANSRIIIIAIHRKSSQIMHFPVPFFGIIIIIARLHLRHPFTRSFGSVHSHTFSKNNISGSWHVREPAAGWMDGWAGILLLI
jgi:hypothetical protein